MTGAIVGVVLQLVVFAAAAANGSGEAGGHIAFTVQNQALHSFGGQRFQASVGSAYARNIMVQATDSAWYMFGQKATSKDRRQLTAVDLVVVDGIAGGGTVATSRTGRIELEARFIGAYPGDIKEEITGILYREVAAVWQADGQGRANAGILNGVADVARIRAGHVPAGWVEAGIGNAWNEHGLGITARFFDYVDRKYQHFLASLNAGLTKATTGDDLFQKITGKSVEYLWTEYKAAYAAA